MRVLESFGPPHRQTNPYIVQLYRSFPEEVDARYFSWGKALRGGYEVFHLHWPEVFVRGTTPFKSLLRGTVFFLILLRIRLGGKALVRTLHDANPHEAPNPLQAWVIGLSERWTTLWITLSDDSQAPAGTLSHRSVVGHFVDWFANGPQGTRPIDAVPGRLVHFGLIRPYKGVPQLLEEFNKISDQNLSLHIIGAVQNDDLRAQIVELAASDPRVRVEDRFVDEEEIRSEVLMASLVVLPFSRITNSSSLILALSLNRPVLAPDVPPIREVAEEVGPGWVHLYGGQLDARDITAALVSLQMSPPASPPDLSRRAWEAIGLDHAHAFDLARSARPRRIGRFQGKRNR